MDQGIRFPNAIWWVQSRLVGGRKVLLIGLVYACALAALMLLVRWMDPDLTPKELVAGAIKILSAAQCVILVIGGCNAVFSAANRDHTTQMLQSHRLSPMSSLGVTVGYAFGANLQVLLLWLAGLVFGGVLLPLAGYSAVPWLVGNGLVLSTAVMVWCFTVWIGVGENKPVNPVGFIVLGGVLGWALVMALPGLGLVTGGYAMAGAWRAMTGHFQAAAAPSAVTSSADLTPLGVAVLVTLNALLAVVWLVAARQRYRRPDRPSLRAAQALVLLVIWVLLCGLGVGLFGLIAPGHLRDLNLAQAQFVATLVLSLILGILPVSAACIDRARLVKGATPRSWSERVSSRLVVVLAAVAICLVMGLMGVRWDVGEGREFVSRLSGETWSRWACTVLAMAGGLLAVEGFLRIMYLVRQRATAVTAWFVSLIWLLPPAADSLIAVLGNTDAGNPFTGLVPTVLFGCSPLGTFVGVWDLMEVTSAALAGGLAVQWLLAVILQVMAARAERREITARRAEGLELPGLAGVG